MIFPAASILFVGVWAIGGLIVRHFLPNNYFLHIAFLFDWHGAVFVLLVGWLMPAVGIGISLALGPVSDSGPESWKSAWSERHHHALWFYGQYLRRRILSVVRVPKAA